MRKSWFKTVALATSIMMASHTTLFCQETRKHNNAVPKDSISQEFNKGFFVYGDFLYWLPEVTSLDYAFEDVRNVNQVLGPRKVFSADYDWAPGFRVGAGYHFNNPWDLEAAYTHLHAHGSDSTHNNIVFPTETFTVGAKLLVDSFYGDGLLSRAKSKIELKYHVFTFDLGRKFVAEKNLLLRGRMGIIAARITQSFDNNYLPVIGTLPPVDTIPLFANVDWKIDGAGLRLGLDFDWNFWRGFSVLASGSIAELLMRQKIDTKTLFDTQNATDRNNHVKFREQRIVPMADLGLGLGWETSPERWWQFKTSIGYQFTIWWNINDIKRWGGIQHGLDDNIAGNVGFHGLFVRAGFDF